MTAKIFHPLLAMIASSTNSELAKYVDYLKVENKILRARIPGQIHTKPEERERLLKYGKVIGRTIEELISIVSPATFLTLKCIHEESIDFRPSEAALMNIRMPCGDARHADDISGTLCLSHAKLLNKELLTFPRTRCSLHKVLQKCTARDW